MTLKVLTFVLWNRIRCLLCSQCIETSLTYTNRFNDAHATNFCLFYMNRDCIYKTNLPLSIKISISADYHPGLRIIKNDNILFQTFIFEFVKVYRLVYVNIVQMLYLPWTKHFSTITTVMLAFGEWKSNGAGMALFHTIIFYPVICDHTTRLICHGPVVHSTFVLSNKHCTVISIERAYTST